MFIPGVRHPQLRPEQSHAWLLLDGLVVDVTHDQFENTGLEGWVFRVSAWHSRFEEIAKPRAPILSPDQWPAYPVTCYEVVRSAVRLV